MNRSLSHRACALTVMAVTLALTACGGGNGGESAPATPTAPVTPVTPVEPATPASYVVSGQVTGLHGLRLTLVNNGEQVAITGDGSFSFPSKLESGTNYAVTTQDPLWTACTVTNGSGVVSADVSVSVSCSPRAATSALVLSTGLAMPQGIAVDGQGNVFVANMGFNTVVKIDPAGISTTFATGLSQPSGVAVDGLGNVYVADQGNSVIRKYAPDGTVISSSWGSGFNQPTYIAADASGNVYVVDWGHGVIKKIDTAGVTTVLNSSMGMGSVVGIAVDANGYVYVPDSSSSRIDKIAPDGTLTPILGASVAGIALDSSGNLFGAEYDANYSGKVVKISPDNAKTNLIIGIGFPYFRGWVAVSGSTVYFTDPTNNTVVKLSPAPQ